MLMRMEAKVNKVVLPGYVLKEVNALRGTACLGPGLRRISRHDACVTKAGVLRFKRPNVYWVHSKQSTYYPRAGDFVVGVVAVKNCETYKVDIGYHDNAVLFHRAMEGTSKKLKKELSVGNMVFGRLIAAHKEMHPEIVCINKFLKAMNMGVLCDGIPAQMNAHDASKILSGRNKFLACFASRFHFETAVGVNGTTWIRGRRADDTLALKDVLKNGKLLKNQRRYRNGFVPRHNSNEITTKIEDNMITRMFPSTIDAQNDVVFVQNR